MTASDSEKTWEDHWASHDTPWDAGESSPALRALLASLEPAPQARALIPGCGRGWDVFTLSRHGFTAVGVDIAPSAAPAFEKIRLEQGLTTHQARMFVGDFFQLDATTLGGAFDFIWDYTFYCAISPELRDSWHEQMARLLAPGGTLAMLIYPVVPGAPRDQGPPYPLDPKEVVERLSPTFDCVQLQKVAQSHPGREGKEWLAIFRKVGT